MRYTAR